MKKLFSLLLICAFTIIKAQEKIPFVDFESVIENVNQYASDKDYDKILEELDKISPNDSVYCSVLTSKSYYSIAKKDFNKALNVIDNGLKGTCDNSTKLYLYMNKGVCYANLNDYQSALEAYNEGLKLFPKNAKLWYNKGIAYENLKNIPEAIEAYQTAIYYSPLYKNAHLQLGNICYRQHLISQALMCFNMCMLIDPDSENSFEMLKSINNVLESTNENEKQENLQISVDDVSFEEIDLILSSKLSLNENYETGNEINIAFVRQNHALLNSLKNFKGNGGFWDKYYVPLFMWINNNNDFNNFIYATNYTIQNEDYKKIISKNESKLSPFLKQLYTKWYELIGVNSKVSSNENKRLFYANKVLQSEGQQVDGKNVGEWLFYGNEGFLMAEGNFNDNGERHGDWKWFYDNGQTKEIASYKNGKLNGENFLYFEDGTPYIYANYTEDEFDGLYQYYLKNGALAQKKFFKNGNLNGLYTSYFKVGESLPEFHIEYENNQVKSKVIEYFAHGSIYSEIEFQNGVKNGKEITYYANGNKSFEAEYTNDVLNGTYLTYYTNGQIKLQGQTVNGNFEGSFKTYYYNGILENDYTFVKGSINGSYLSYDIDGKLFSKFTYKNGEIIAYEYYDKNEKIISSNKKKGGEFEFNGKHPNGNDNAVGVYDVKGGKKGLWKFYNRNGALSEEGIYEDDQPVGTHTAYHSNGEISTISNYLNGELDGYYQYFHVNGQLSTQGWYKGGLQHGEWRYYYIDGTLSSKQFFHKGELHGKQINYTVKGNIDFVSYYEYGMLISIDYHDMGGNIRTHINYLQEPIQTIKTMHYNNITESETDLVNGLKHGNYKYYDFYGQLRLKGSYLNDLMNGTWTWYNKEGDIEAEENYLNGNRHGVSTYYHQNGQIENQYLYDYGMQTGEWKSYHQNGAFDVVTNHEDGVEVGKKYFYDISGNLQLIRHYNHGILIGYSYLNQNNEEIEIIPIVNETGKITAYYNNGKPSRTMEFKNGVFVNEYKSFYYGGQLKETFKYEKGEYHGLVKEYYENGQLHKTSTYIYGIKNGKFEEFYSNGTLKESKHYSNDVLHGEYNYYDESGNILKTEYYYNGDIYKSIEH